MKFTASCWYQANGIKWESYAPPHTVQGNMFIVKDDPFVCILLLPKE